MATLLLRLAAPLQSWGVRSKFEIRQTEREPSKSGVIGLLACAMGISREDQEALEKLSRLEFGVRVDQEGQLLRDFHMVHAYKNRQDYRTGEKHQCAYITERYYLADAVFLAGVSTDDRDLLKQLEEALVHPAFPLYLGRRSCPPSLPILLGRRDCSLWEALQQEPWLAAEWYRKRFPQGQPVLRLTVDSAAPGAASVCDVPVSFRPACRQYAFRNVAAQSIPMPMTPTEHDAMMEVEECT